MVFNKHVKTSAKIFNHLKMDEKLIEALEANPKNDKHRSHNFGLKGSVVKK